MARSDSRGAERLQLAYRSDKVLDKIEKMDADKAKEYLKRLIKENMNVGIEIISEGGSEA
jgi:DNA-binding GntR family transcriptional regulator